MLIAEEIITHGMSSGVAFNAQLTETVLRYKPSKIIETGTYYGEGTTLSLVQGVLKAGRSARIITIEDNIAHYRTAKNNLSPYTFVSVWNGCSVARSQVPRLDRYEVPEGVIIDHKSLYRAAAYNKEIRRTGPDNLLEKALKEFNGAPDLVVLDSAGHLGFIEFEYLMQRVKGKFLLALDDTCHLKHFKTMEYIKQRGEQFTILWEVVYHKDKPENKFGSALISVH